MARSQTIRLVSVSSLMAAILGVFVLSARLVWPHWVEYRAERAFISALRDPDGEGFTEAMESLRKIGGDEALLCLLCDEMKENDADLQKAAFYLLRDVLSADMGFVPTISPA